MCACALAVPSSFSCFPPPPPLLPHPYSTPREGRPRALPLGLEAQVPTLSLEAVPGSTLSLRLPLKACTPKQKPPTTEIHHFLVRFKYPPMFPGIQLPGKSRKVLICFLGYWFGNLVSSVAGLLLVSATSLTCPKEPIVIPLACLEAVVRASEFFTQSCSVLLPASGFPLDGHITWDSHA